MFALVEGCPSGVMGALIPSGLDVRLLRKARPGRTDGGTDGQIGTRRDRQGDRQRDRQRDR